MAIEVVIFDFDGTLVDSNRLKYDAYFELFAADANHVRTIREVLAEINEKSRYDILEEICRRLNADRKDGINGQIKHLADRYGDIVFNGAKTCPEMPGAGNVLRSLSRPYRLYLSSTTPEDSLKKIVHFRGWARYFVDVFGYPRQKSESIRRILTRENAAKSQVVVVGDRENDRQSAAETGCHFIHAADNFRLADLARRIKSLTND
jgi:phosphoglycolate phosphatase-like HAD superfamily hydrolase